MLTRARRTLALASTAGLLIGGLTVGLTTAPTPAAASAADTAAACVDVLDAPMPAARALAGLSTSQRRAVAAVNGLSARALADEAGSTDTGTSSGTDHTLWLDECGHRFYAEPDTSAEADETLAEAQAAGTLSTSDVATAEATGDGPVAPLADSLALNSRPGANLTIFLDFDGATVSGTAWNTSAYNAGASITVPPYQLDGSTDASFTTNELIQIQRAWSIVAEDYAPFDVNVTTQDPGPDAIDRSSATDRRYGTRVLVTAHGPIYSYCGCGGVAYVDVFDTYGTALLGHDYYQPAWVFTDGTSPQDGKFIAEAASHEAGHTLGLSHDGTQVGGVVTDYYKGASPWAAIMGAGYYDPVTQWSAGEYPNANNHEDDIALIASRAPYVVDDHGNTAATATVLTPGTEAAPGTPVTGLIGTRTDVDAFTFTADATTMAIDVTPTAVQPDLDVGLTVLDAAGAVLATVDPPVVDNGRLNPAGGLDAHDSLATTVGERYTVIVDGVASGDPSTAGRYSDYGSLGRYRIAVNGSDPAALVIRNLDGGSAAVAPPTIVGSTAGSFDVTPFQATGGSGGYTWTASGLPDGLDLDAATGRLTGRPTAGGRWSPRVTVTDSAGAGASVSFTMTVTAADPLRITTTTLTAVAGTTFVATLGASGWTGGYGFSSVNLPTWLTLGTDGTLRGTPTTAGTSTFDLTVTSGSGSALSTVTGTVSVVVATPAIAPTGAGSAASVPVHVTVSAPTLAKARFPKARKGRAYRATLIVRDGTPTITWSRAGALPRGLSLRTSGTGRKVIVSGKPVRVGRYRFTLTGRDADGRTVRRVVVLTVKR